MKPTQNPSKSTGDRYTNTRVRVMKSKLLKKEDFEKLMKMTVDEIARFLQESDYRKEIDEFALKYSGINLLEYALSKNLANSFRRIQKFSLRQSQSNIDNYLKKWDVWNLKTILRGKQSKASEEEILSTLVVAGTLGEEFLKKAIESSDSVDSAIEQFRRTEYYPLLKEHSKNLTELEDALDRHYYKYAIENFPEDLKKYIMTQITMLNILNEARAKKAEIKFTKLEGGIKESRIKVKADRSDVEEIAREMNETSVKSSSKMVHEFTRSIRPVIGYFIAKETETRNLRLLVRGKHSGLPAEVIEKNLVI